jgi:hypothetical protein
MSKTAEPRGRERKTIENVKLIKTELVLSARGKTIEEKLKLQRSHKCRNQKLNLWYQFILKEHDLMNFQT